MAIVQQYQNPKANQELILHFEENASDSATSSIEDITSALEHIGVDDISITSEGNIYRISYYSDSEITKVKELLSKSLKTSFDSKRTPKESKNKNLDFDIFKIEDGRMVSWDFEAQEVQIYNLKSDRSNQPNVFKFPVLVELDQLQIQLNVTLEKNRYIIFFTDNTSHNIPEVRAGPLS